MNVNKYVFRISVFGLFFIVSTVNAQQQIEWNTKNSWVDSVYQTLTPEQRIAQLMMIASWSGRDSAHIKDIACHVNEIGVGGIIFFKGTPTRQAALTNYYQSISKVPLLIGIDGEWGLSMRLDSTPVFPRQVVMGAAKNEKLVYEFGRAIGNQCKRMGIHFNFAPVVDVNNNPRNPVINDRSFGENKYTVARLGSAYMKGMQSTGIMASAKHFPGHGDVASDSHYNLPVIEASRNRLDSLELYPFQELIRDGVMGVMVAHLYVPALDTTVNLPSSVSYNVISNLLKNEMDFQGLVITDALNMKGVADFYAKGEVAAKALMAGNDILLFVEDVPQAIATILQYIERGDITWTYVEQRVKKILLAKYWVGLSNYKPIELNQLVEDLNCCEAQLMIEKVVKQGIVIALNEEKVIPVQNPHAYKIATVSVGVFGPTVFQEYVMRYVSSDYFSIDKTERTSYFDSLYENLQPYNLIFVSLHNTSRFVSKNYGLTPSQIDFVNRLLSGSKKVVLINHGNAYLLDRFVKAKHVIQAYEDLDVYQKYSAQLLFGAYSNEATLPVTVNANLKQGQGYSFKPIKRLQYGLPGMSGVDEHTLHHIDTIALQAIQKGAMPGCQILIAKSGTVFYQKSFGTLDYSKQQAVQNYYTYDLASLTKILSTTLAIMALVDDGKLEITDPVSLYLPELKQTNKADITIEKILLHEAGLLPFVPFYKKWMINGVPNPIVFSTTRDSIYSIQVATQLYMHADMEVELWNSIIKTEVKKQGTYVYSDLGFIILGKLIERITHSTLDQYVAQRIYKPLGLTTLGYKPLVRIPEEWIPPTEFDTVFRQQLVRGTVHDQTAALMGGVAGHAGLFGNANDVAILMQLLLNGGTYGGQRILYEQTVKEFTKKHTKHNRRGYGFDKPETEQGKASPVPSEMSALTFGHTGFTGTAVWCDPKYELIIVFLSNRVHPDAENKKLTDMNVRSQIISHIYEALGLN